MLKIEEQPKIHFRSREGFSLASLWDYVGREDEAGRRKNHSSTKNRFRAFRVPATPHRPER